MSCRAGPTSEISSIETVPTAEREGQDEVGNDGVHVAMLGRTCSDTASQTLWGRIRQSLDGVAEATDVKLNFSQLFAVDEIWRVPMHAAQSLSSTEFSGYLFEWRKGVPFVSENRPHSIHGRPTSSSCIKHVRQLSKSRYCQLVSVSLDIVKGGHQQPTLGRGSPQCGGDNTTVRALLFVGCTP